MPDTQRSKLFAAEEEVWRDDPPLTLAEARALVHEFNHVHDREVTLHEAPATGHLKLLVSRRGGELWAPTWALRLLPLLHELAHTLVHPVFPEHGTEFITALLALVRAHASPAREADLRAAFTRAKLIVDPANRQKRAKRDATWYVNQAPGTTLKVIAGDPPELLVGDVGDLHEGLLQIGTELIALDRVRYVWRVAAPPKRSK